MGKIRQPDDLHVLVDQLQDYMSKEATVILSLNDLFAFLEADKNHVNTYVLHYECSGTVQQICKAIATLSPNFVNAMFTVKGKVGFLSEVNEIAGALRQACGNEVVRLSFAARYEDMGEYFTCNIYLLIPITE